MQVAWLYNIRGTDVSYCPVVHAFAIITSSSAFLYVDKRKVSAEVSFIIHFNCRCLLQCTFAMFFICNLETLFLRFSTFNLFSYVQDFPMIFILYSFTFFNLCIS